MEECLTGIWLLGKKPPRQRYITTRYIDILREALVFDKGITPMETVFSRDIRKYVEGRACVTVRPITSPLTLLKLTKVYEKAGVKPGEPPKDAEAFWRSLEPVMSCSVNVWLSLS